ncbi:amidohydrolase family protein [Elioraea sp.]|uniref:amidohydrolase family protein n=1 Tax=Elioraea sp. TaxID=2185103 RepID=UPI003F724B2A
MPLDAAAAEALRARLAWLEAEGAGLVIDGDTHATDPALIPAPMRARMQADPNYFHGRPLAAEELVWEMDAAGVDAALCWQNPSATLYGPDPEANRAALWAANRAIAEAASRWPRRFIPAGWTDPRALGRAAAIALAHRCVEQLGCVVVKMNPAQNGYRIDEPDVLAVVDAIVALGAVPAFHYGADTEFTPAEGLERIAARHPGHPVMGVHMGGGGGHFVASEPLYQATRALGLRWPNLFWILSARRDPHSESDLIAYCDAGAPFDRAIALGSDAPYGRMTWNFGGWRAMLASLRDPAHPDPRIRANPHLFAEATVARLLGGNLAALLIAAHRRVLGLPVREAA